jgi:hypothetical protein
VKYAFGLVPANPPVFPLPPLEPDPRIPVFPVPDAVHPAAIHRKTNMQTIARTIRISEEYLINPHHFLIE